MEAGFNEVKGEGWFGNDSVFEDAKLEMKMANTFRLLHKNHMLSHVFDKIRIGILHFTFRHKNEKSL